MGWIPSIFYFHFVNCIEWVYLWMNWMDKWFDLSPLNIIKKLKNEILCVNMFAPTKLLSKFHWYVYDSVTWISQPLAHHLHQCNVQLFSLVKKWSAYMSKLIKNKVEKILKSYLTNNDISPVYPSKAWKAEPIIIAPWSSFIIWLNFCKIEKQISSSIFSNHSIRQFKILHNSQLMSN